MEARTIEYVAKRPYLARVLARFGLSEAELRIIEPHFDRQSCDGWGARSFRAGRRRSSPCCRPARLGPSQTFGPHTPAHSRFNRQAKRDK